MYRDNSLIPSEAIRLAALGILARRPMTYADLASEVRQFTGRLVGPSLDLMGPPIELLKVEGLIAPDADGRLRITEGGWAALRALLSARLGGPLGELGKLFVALKLRFLDLLPPAEQRLQAERLVEAAEREAARVADLRQRYAEEGGLFAAWLDHDLAAIETRLAWFRSLKDRLGG